MKQVEHYRLGKTDVNSLAAIGGSMIIVAFISYIFISYALAYLFGTLGLVFLLAGVMTAKNE